MKNTATRVPRTFWMLILFSLIVVVGSATGANAAARLDAGLTWSTFLGGSGQDYSRGTTVDGDGNMYVVGISGASWGTPVRAFSGANDDAYVAKLDSDGALLWNTFLGSSGVDQGIGIAVDGSGNVYVVGISGASWGSPVRAFSGFNDDAFAAKLDSDGELTWNTFLGSVDPDSGQGIAVDGDGNALVVGISDNTWGSPVRAFTSSFQDAFATKLDSDGELTWNTFLGGDGFDHGKGIVADASGNVYVVGISTNTWGSPVRAFTGFNDDAFAAKLDSDGELVWHTFLGGDGVDHGQGIAADESGNAYVVGISGASWGSPVRAFGGGFNDDGFAVKLDEDGELTWNTFLGGPGIDNGAAIAVDGGGELYVTGISSRMWGIPARAFTGKNNDAFAARLTSEGALAGNLFLGGAQVDYGQGITVDGSGSVYVAGISGGTWGTPLRAFSGSNSDTFAAKLPAIPSCTQAPETPLLLKPDNKVVVPRRKVRLDWTDADCAGGYQLVVTKGSRGAPPLINTPLNTSAYKTKPLERGAKYFWRVTATGIGDSKSAWHWFKIE